MNMKKGIRTDEECRQKSIDEEYKENLPNTDKAEFTKTELLILGLCALLIAAMLLSYQFLTAGDTGTVKYKKVQTERQSSPDNYSLQNKTLPAAEETQR